MGLLETEIKELRDMNKLLAKGSIKPEDVHARIAIYSQTEKRAKMILQAFTLAAKHGKRTMTAIEKTNLLGDGAAIDTDSDDELEKVKCPALDGLVTRSDCLDMSGDAKHPPECDGCENFNTTRSKLLV